MTDCARERERERQRERKRERDEGERKEMASSKAAQIKAELQSTQTVMEDLAGNIDLKGLCEALFAVEMETNGKPVKISFTVGAGKKGRQKYAENLPRAFMVELEQQHGMTEDRGASLCAASAGTFKFQHDTDKDLKFVHVFPKYVVAAEEDTNDDGSRRSGGGAGAERRGGDGGQEEDERRCYACDASEFESIVSKNVTSFSQRRVLLRLLKARSASVKALFERLSNREALSEAENAIIEATVDVDEKLALLSKETEAMMDGKLTADEKETLVREFESKIKAAEEQAASSGGGSSAARAKHVRILTEKRDNVAAADVVEPSGLSNERALRPLYAEVHRLEKLEKSKQLHSLDVLREINTKPEIEEKIAALEKGCRRWFVDPAMVDKRLKKIRANAASQGQKKKGGGGGGSSLSSSHSKGGGGMAGGFTQVKAGAKRSSGNGASSRSTNSNAFSLLS